MTEWQTLINSKLVDDQAIFTKSDTQHLALKETILVDLSHLGLLALDGEDAQLFLQGQVTNDVKLLNKQSHYTGYCTAKGRLLALFLAFQHADSYYLQCPQEILASTLKRLNMYILRSKVRISDASNAFARIGLAGPQVEKLFASLGCKVPQVAHEITEFTHGIAIRCATSVPSYEILLEIEHAQAVVETLTQHCVSVSKNCWDLLEIEAGIPEINAHTQEKFVPQMVNLDLLNGINFKKGCYTGQEIVARTHYLGKVKRRTLLAHIDIPVTANVLPVAGDDITVNGEPAGNIVRVARNPFGGVLLLAEVHLESTQQQTAYWSDYTLAFQTLPYQTQE